MKEVLHAIQSALVVAGGAIGWFLGGVDGLVYALIVFVVIDYITGLMLAVIRRKVSSEVGYNGIFKKVLIFAMVGIGQIVDCYLIGSGSTIRTAILFFYLSNEGLSILENVALIGLPIPEKMKRILVELKGEDR